MTGSGALKFRALAAGNPAAPGQYVRTGVISWMKWSRSSLGTSVNGRNGAVKSTLTVVWPTPCRASFM